MANPKTLNDWKKAVGRPATSLVVELPGGIVLRFEGLAQ